jgi:hypothetical protein
MKNGGAIEITVLNACKASELGHPHQRYELIRRIRKVYTANRSSVHLSLAQTVPETEEQVQPMSPFTLNDIIEHTRLIG